MRFQPPQLLAGRPETEPPRGKSLIAEPETLTVIDQYLHRCGLAVAEHEQAAGERVVILRDIVLDKFVGGIDPTGLIIVNRIERHTGIHVTFFKIQILDIPDTFP